MSPLASIPAFGALGALLGVLNALALRRAVRRLTEGKPSLAAVALGALVRNLSTLAPLFLLAGSDVGALVTGLTAFVVARLVAVRRLAARLGAATVGAAR